MRSQIRFVMHPDDETDFVARVKDEPGTVLIDGPKWPTPDPPLVADLARAGSYLILWNARDARRLETRHYERYGVEWWYCVEDPTIQFLRSGFQFGEAFLVEGSIAVGTPHEGVRERWECHAAVEKRYESLRKVIRKSYVNNVLIWQNTTLPRSKTNPVKPARDVWVGPHALQWMRTAPRGRWVQQFRDSAARAYLIDLVSPEA